MPVLPHDISDLHLAPLVLALDARIEDLGKLTLDELTKHVALVSNRPDWDRRARESALLLTLEEALDLHGWTLSWHARGLQMQHDAHRFVLGIPAVFTDYLTGAYREATTA